VNSRRLLRRCRPDQIPFVAHFAHTQPFVDEISLCLRATTAYRIRTITHAAIKARRLRRDRYPLNIASRIRTISRTAIKARTTSIQEIVTCYHSLGRPACICSQILFLSLIEDMATISVCFNVYLVEQNCGIPKQDMISFRNGGAPLVMAFVDVKLCPGSFEHCVRRRVRTCTESLAFALLLQELVVINVPESMMCTCNIVSHVEHLVCHALSTIRELVSSCRKSDRLTCRTAISRPYPLVAVKWYHSETKVEARDI
jgi:hypothetical protein